MISFKQGAIASVVVGALAVVALNVSWNEAGKRQLVQYGNGTLACTFEPGPYMTWFGGSTEYPDVISFDFDKSVNPDDTTLDQDGIGVRYRDGGLGTVYGIARYSLPNDCPTFTQLHKDLRSNSGLANKLIKPYTEEVANQTAGLMTSEESYAEKRGIFTDWFRTQLVNGRFKTRMDEIITTEPGKEYCLETELLTDDQKRECKTVKKTRERVPVIDDRGTDIHLSSDLKKYGITLSGFQLQAPDYEPKTLQQISDKREATMGVITANANAERAKAEAVEAEQRGLKDVTVAKYEKEQEKIRAVVAAEQAAEVAVIQAEQQVDVAEQQKLEAEQKAFAALEYEKEQEARGRGDAAYKKMVMEADGALQQKLDAYRDVNANYAQALGNHRLVPDVQMGESQAGGATNLIQMLEAKTAKDLALDLNMK